MKFMNIKTQQTELFQAMARAEFYPHLVTKVEQRETHISMVFLTGNYVYKIKKAVNLGFLDYTSLNKRKFYCQQEIILNRRLSHDTYMGIVPISLKDGCYVLDGPGQAVEYAVKMRQLPEERSMKQLMRRGKIDRKTIDQLTHKLIEFYGDAPTGEGIDSYGALETIWANCEENFLQLERFAGNIIDARMFRIIQSATQSFLHRSKVLIKQRKDAGKIRDCHGDLRTGHVYWVDGIQIIDCIEFNERFRYSDITADLAFLIMDIEYRGFPKIAQQLLDLYVRKANDPDAFILIDFYKCYRALVRTKVNCLRLTEPTLGRPEKKKLSKETNQYLNLAYRYAILFTRPCIWVVCGMVASGKSTVAVELARRLGIEVLHSDLIRKKLFGVQPKDFMNLPFEEGIYSKRASSLTYGKVFELAQQEIANGLSVILDATFNDEHMRNKALLLARDMEANIIFVECTAPEKVLRHRLLEREAKVTISDARLCHFRQFQKQFEPLGDLIDGGHIRVDTQLSIGQNMMEILFHAYHRISMKITGETENIP